MKRNVDFWTFGACMVASFGSGWATAMLSDVPPEKALASGIIAMCSYVLGKQQTPMSNG